MTTDTAPIIEDKPPIFVKYVIVLVILLLTMGAGLLLASYAPIWLTPPVENFNFTFLIYFSVSSMLWVVTPLIFWRRWHLKISNKIRLFVVVPSFIALVLFWMTAFSLIFGSQLSNRADQNMFLNLLLTRYPVCDVQSTTNGTVTYNCGGCQFYIEGEEWDAGFVGDCWNYTFEGREGLPFVRYTGTSEETANHSD